FLKQNCNRRIPFLIFINTFLSICHRQHILLRHVVPRNKSHLLNLHCCCRQVFLLTQLLVLQKMLLSKSHTMDYPWKIRKVQETLL
ncbi:hypothetical protein Ocin01_13429, partial [Orchesella cincta]